MSEHDREGGESTADDGYHPPLITRLGTLAELTQGGDPFGVDDGFGNSGDVGSI